MWDGADEAIADVDLLAIGVGAEDACVEVEQVVKDIEGAHAFEVGVYIQTAIHIEDFVAEDIGFFAYIDCLFKSFAIGEGEVLHIGVGPQSVFPVGVFCEPGRLESSILLGKLSAEPNLVDDFGDFFFAGRFGSEVFFVQMFHESPFFAIFGLIQVVEIQACFGHGGVEGEEGQTSGA